MFDLHILEESKPSFENSLQLIAAGSIDPAEADTQVAVDPPANNRIRGKGLGTNTVDTEVLQPAAAEQSEALPGQPKTPTTEALQPAAPAEQSKALAEAPKTPTTEALQAAAPAEQSKTRPEAPKTPTTEALQPVAPAEQSKAVPEASKTPTTQALQPGAAAQLPEEPKTEASQPTEALPEKPKTQTTEASQPALSLPLHGQPEPTHDDDVSESSTPLNLFDAQALLCRRHEWSWVSRFRIVGVVIHCSRVKKALSSQTLGCKSKL